MSQDNPATLGLQQMRAELDRGEVRAVELLRACRRRVEVLDRRLHAFVRFNPRAEAEAEAADRLIESGNSGPLTGVPVALKDNLATEGLETSCCSRILEGFEPVQDATAVARLRRAGAVIVGKTNMDEFGMGSSTENSAFGPTRNPWDTERVSGGSSGGSAVAVAAGMVPVSLGSDTGGSVRQPAAFCGVVGLKPSYGRVSRFGLVAYGSSLDQVGPIARSVGDAAAALECIAGPDPLDMTTVRQKPQAYSAACDAGVAGLTVGLPREYLADRLDPEISAAVHLAAGALGEAGAAVREISLPHTRYAISSYYLLATAEASSNLARYDAVRYGRRVDRGAGLQAMYRDSRGRGFGEEVQRRIMLGTFALSAGYQDAYYRKAQRVRRLIRQDFVDRFDEGIDLILTPVTPTLPFRLGEKLSEPLEMYLSDVFTVTANLAGLPALALPIGRSRAGLPVGVQLIGPAFGEDLLFRAGSALERRCPAEPLPC
jgi:aspartyl-tRNA(Asn)/glutamyl-tRNA(Gln) amidotransferase subunit A